MSWLYSRALVEVYLAGTCSDGARSARLRSSLTRRAYCAPAKMMDFSRLSRYGMTCGPFRESRGEVLLTWFQEVSPARTSAPPARAQASRGGAWHRSGSMRSGMCSERTMSARRISARGCGFWPTPTVHGNNNRAKLSPKAGDGLATAVRRFDDGREEA